MEFNLPRIETIKSSTMIQLDKTDRRKQLEKQFVFRDILKSFVQEGFQNPELQVASLYMVLKNLGLFKKYKKQYGRLLLILNNEEINQEVKSKRVYNKIKNWYLSLEGINFKSH